MQCKVTTTEAGASCKKVTWGAPTHSLLFPFPVLPLPSLPLPSPSFSLPLEVGPLIAAMGSGGALWLPQRAPTAKLYTVYITEVLSR